MNVTTSLARDFSHGLERLEAAPKVMDYVMAPFKILDETADSDELVYSRARVLKLSRDLILVHYIDEGFQQWLSPVSCTVACSKERTLTELPGEDGGGTLHTPVASNPGLSLPPQSRVRRVAAGTHHPSPQHPRSVLAVSHQAGVVQAPEQLRFLLASECRHCNKPCKQNFV